MEFHESARNKDDISAKVRHLEHLLEAERTYTRQLEQERRILQKALMADLAGGECVNHRITALTAESERLASLGFDTAPLRTILERLEAQKTQVPVAAELPDLDDSHGATTTSLAIDPFCLHALRELSQENGYLQRTLARTSADPNATARMLEEQQSLRDENIRLNRKLTNAFERLNALEKTNFQIRAQAEMDDERAFNMRRSVDASPATTGHSPIPRTLLGTSPSMHSMPSHTGFTPARLDSLGRSPSGSGHFTSPSAASSRSGPYP